MRGPSVLDVPGQLFDAEAVARADDQLEPVAPATAAVPFGEQQRHAIDHVAVDLGEAGGRVPEAVVLTPSPQEAIEISDQLSDPAQTRSTEKVKSEILRPTSATDATKGFRQHTYTLLASKVLKLWTKQA